MLPQKQPNAWSCLPTAFAMVCDMPVEELIAKIGHDGSRERYAEPKPQIGFHIQEIIDALYHDYSITEIIEAQFDNGDIIMVQYKTLQQRIYDAMIHFSGVLWVTRDQEYGHALAWDHTQQFLYDPKFGDNSDVPMTFKILGFWIVEARSGSKINDIHQGETTTPSNGCRNIGASPICP